MTYAGRSLNFGADLSDHISGIPPGVRRSRLPLSHPERQPMRDVFTILCFLTLAATLGAGETDVPLGHPDFYPTPDRPIGWRGDATGRYPGATPVLEWDEATKKNILWQAELPHFGNGSPIVVGDRIFVMADPDWLLCVDAASGKELWRRSICPPIETLPMLERAVARDALTQCSWSEYEHDLTRTASTGAIGPKRGKNGLDSKELCWISAAQRALPDNQPLKRWVERCESVLKTPYSQRQETLVTFKGEGGRPHITTSYVEFGGHWPALGNLALASTYNNWFSQVFCEPVSDGEHVYVRAYQGVIACYDLEGNRRWVWIQPSGITSPRMNVPIMLWGDYVYVPDGMEGLWVIDKRTGQPLPVSSRYKDDKGNDRDMKDRLFVGKGHEGVTMLLYTLEGDRYFLSHGVAIRLRDHTVDRKSVV